MHSALTPCAVRPCCSSLPGGPSIYPPVLVTLRASQHGHLWCGRTLLSSQVTCVFWSLFSPLRCQGPRPTFPLDLNAPFLASAVISDHADSQWAFSDSVTPDSHTCSPSLVKSTAVLTTKRRVCLAEREWADLWMAGISALRKHYRFSCSHFTLFQMLSTMVLLSGLE